MASGINKAIIIGNLGDDPESRVLPQGGIFTTAERSDLKSNEFNEARKVILGETA